MENIDYKNLRAETLERLKELATLNRTTALIKEGKPFNETLQNIAYILPNGWQYPNFTSACIKFDNKEYRSANFIKTQWVQKQEFHTIDLRKGSIEIYYSKSFKNADEGPFLTEERDLIYNLANIITGYLNSEKGKAVLLRYGYQDVENEDFLKKEKCSITGPHLMQRFLNKNNYNRDIYHDLMPFKVKEILIISNLYDAYSIEKEGRFSEHMMDEYTKLNLTSLPRITGVSSREEAIEHLQSKHFDMIIIMVGIDRTYPLNISKGIKKEFPYIPVFLLLNNNYDVNFFEKNREPFSFDRIFVWNGESRIFFTMIKHVEDRINIDNDTRIALVRFILVVEDSPMYYSRYLPILYKIVLDQTRRIIDDVSTDDLYKVLKLRARPKILLASTYEEAIEIYEKYKEFIFCLITDVKFDRAGKKTGRAGFELVDQVRSEKKNIPVIIQSSDEKHADQAHLRHCMFIWKNSETLEQEIKSFITHYLGFGNFIYRNGKGKKLVEVKTLKEFEKQLKKVPAASILYHAKKDDFSTWLMARGEILAARVLHTKKSSDFSHAEDIRSYLIKTIQKFRDEQKQGEVIPFEASAILDESNIVTLSDGALGGKGRGLAFINSLIYNFDFKQFLPDINLKTPRTTILGIEEFEQFLDNNNLHFVKTDNIPYEEIKWRFLNGKLTPTLIKRLKELLKLIKKPIAIRSSGLFEDSLMQPFAGIFETFLLPNNHPELNVRLQQTMDAIKLVYASVYSEVAVSYFKAVNYRVEEEKMAIVIQEVVGRNYGSMFYPHISGVAQSYNYYPFAHMKPDEGFVVAAFGLGKYVVEGEKAYRFSPKYPSTEINTTRDQVQNSQTEFYAVDLKKQDINLMVGDTAGLIKADIYEAEKQGTLKHCASVFDANNNTISAGIEKPGPRIINFANILKYKYIPMAKAIEVVLEIVQEAMGSPVEIEFAIDLNKDENNRASFYLLQIKPMIGNASDYTINMDEIDKSSILLYTEKAMGNGSINTIRDVIYVASERFNKAETEKMAEEIDRLNTQMQKEGKQYLLIVPGRWGTRDRWIGIPVNWPQISNAKVIVETILKGYRLDTSAGSHFFHIVTSAKGGYFSVQPEKSGSLINYEILYKQHKVEETKYFKHVRFNETLKIKMDGRKRISVVSVK